MGHKRKHDSNSEKELEEKEEKKLKLEKTEEGINYIYNKIYSI